MRANADSAQPDFDMIERMLRESWNSLATLAFRCEEFGLDEAGRRNYSQPTQRLDWLFGEGDRLSLTTSQVETGGSETHVSLTRQDGRRQYAIMPFDGYPGSISDVYISAQKDTRGFYSGRMCAVLWLIMPGGRPPHVHLEQNGSLAIVKAGGRDSVVLSSTHRGLPVRCTLDPDHDWMPAPWSWVRRQNILLRSDPIRSRPWPLVPGGRYVPEQDPDWTTGKEPLQTDPQGIRRFWTEDQPAP